jgi:branched-chain amino acid transport system substrate-binding protein
MREAPDAVLLPNFSVRDSSQVRLFREAGFRGPFLGSDAWDAIALRGRQYIDGSIIVGNWDGRSDREGVRTFRDRWNARYLGERPRATGAATYDAIRLIARAAERARAKSGMALATALRTGAPFDGAFASYRFDGSGDPIRGATLLEMDRDSLLFRVTLSTRR